ncbi:MAG: flagellar hook-basal body protein [Clostridiaceae bacterium]|nr:flagellar hook-basal body protein [Clostridiaceae bacterium]
MIRGLYISSVSMLKEQKKMDVISNNLANASTTAFKKDITVFQSFPEILTKRMNDRKNGEPYGAGIGTMRLGSDVVQVFTDYSQGTLMQTDRPTDISLKGDNSAFFVVSVPREDGMIEMYTRDGSWTLDSEGYLVTREGYRVAGEEGDIYLGTENFTVKEDGSIYVDDEYIDSLRIVSFIDTTSLLKYGENLVQAAEEAETRPFQGQVVQGYLENSNINPVEEMVDMIQVMRAYEANQKVINAYDDTLDKIINEVGRV